MKIIIILGVILLVSLFYIFVFALCKAAAPKNDHQRLIDDYQQMKALGYFKNAQEQKEMLDYISQTITSGCPVNKESEFG